MINMATANIAVEVAIDRRLRSMRYACATIPASHVQNDLRKLRLSLSQGFISSIAAVCFAEHST